jgi:serine/threonine protein kinase
MAYLHSRKPSPVLHGDLKIANLLLDNDASTLVIADFGLAGWSDGVVEGFPGSQAAAAGALTVTIAPPEVSHSLRPFYTKPEHLSLSIELACRQWCFSIGHFTRTASRLIIGWCSAICFPALPCCAGNTHRPLRCCTTPKPLARLRPTCTHWA